MDRQKTNRMAEAILSDKTMAKHMLKHEWMSGSSTMVAPLTIGANYASAQVDTDRPNTLNKAIRRIVDNNKDLFGDGRFCKYDGSCPSEVRFYYAD